MDAVSLFAIIVFSLAWWFHDRTPANERVVRLFLGTLMAMGAAVGVLGWILRALR